MTLGGGGRRSGVGGIVRAEPVGIEVFTGLSERPFRKLVLGGTGEWRRASRFETGTWRRPRGTTGSR